MDFPDTGSMEKKRRKILDSGICVDIMENISKVIVGRRRV